MSHCCSRADLSRAARVFGSGTTEQPATSAARTSTAMGASRGHERIGHVSAMTLVEDFESGVERLAPRSEQDVRVVHRDPAKRDPLAGLDLTNASDIERAD